MFPISVYLVSTVSLGLSCQFYTLSDLVVNIIFQKLSWIHLFHYEK